MYTHELYKIFTRKSLYATFILLLAFPLLSLGFDRTTQTTQYQEVYEENRGPITDEKLAFANEQIELFYETAPTIEYEEETVIDFDNLSIEEEGEFKAYSQINQADHLTEYTQLSIQELEETAESLDSNSYQYAETMKELEMLETRRNSYGFYNLDNWEGLFFYYMNGFTTLFLPIMILLGLSPVFAGEYANQTAELIFYTKNGKKHLIKAKILASLTYTTIVFLIVNVYYFILNWIQFGPPTDSFVPFQNTDMYFTSPYNLTVIYYYLSALGIQLLTCLALVILVLLLSVWTNNSLHTFFVSGMIVLAPNILTMFGLEYTFTFVQTFIDFSYVRILELYQLFSGFRAFNLFGYPIMYPYLVIPLMLIIISLFTYLIYQVYKRQEITF